MGIPFIVSLAAVLASVVAARFLAEQALKTLANGQKLRVVEGFSSMRKWHTVPLLVVAALMFVALHLRPEHGLPIVGVFFLLVGAHFVVVYWLTKRKLRALDLPDKYIRRVLGARHLTHAGFAVFLLALFLGALSADGPGQSNPRKLSDTFMHALPRDPALALSLMEGDYRDLTSVNQFAAFVAEMLPADADSAQIRFVKFEDGFVEGDGAHSSQYQYRLAPKGNAPALTVEVHVVRHEGAYYVRRFSIPLP